MVAFGRCCLIGYTLFSHRFIFHEVKSTDHARFRGGAGGGWPSHPGNAVCLETVRPWGRVDPALVRGRCAMICVIRSHSRGPNTIDMLRSMGGDSQRGTASSLARHVA